MKDRWEEMKWNNNNQQQPSQDLLKRMHETKQKNTARHENKINKGTKNI